MIYKCGGKKKGKKRVALIVLAMLCVSGLAYAEQTGTSFWHSHSYTDNDSWRDEYSEYQKKLNAPVGLGLDAVVYEFNPCMQNWGLNSVNVEYKYDMANNGHSVYGVTHVNLWDLGKKLLG